MGSRVSSKAGLCPARRAWLALNIKSGTGDPLRTELSFPTPIQCARSCCSLLRAMSRGTEARAGKDRTLNLD
jgi:hypothetical protein